MKKTFFLGLLLNAYGFLSAQTPTWSGNIAKVIYGNCTSCHHSGGAAPFSMISYGQTFNNRSLIKTFVSQKLMPPWPPDSKYSQHAFSRELSESEIQSITSWVDAGAPSGDLTKAPAPPVYDNLGFIKNPELTITMPSYTVSSSVDEYRCFPDSTRLAKDMWMTALECIPGDPSIVHHVLIFKDKGTRSYTLDKNEAGPGYVCFGGAGTSDAELIAAWVPGSGAFVLPKGFGMKIPARSNIIIQVHYPAGAKGKKDQTKVKMQLTDKPQRETFLAPVLNHETSMTNGPLKVPSNTKKTFNQRFVIPFNISLIGVAPHMHLIGTSIKTWAVQGDGKEIPLISIPHWDFHWQGIYQFPNPIRLAPFTALMSEAVYDNTVANHHNPNSPPKEVTQGESTTDEMMITYFLFAAYQAGDERIIIDSSYSLVSGIKSEPVIKKEMYISINPGAINQASNLYIQSESNDKVKVSIFDIRGTLIQTADHLFAIKGHQSIALSKRTLIPGIYIVKAQGKNWTGSAKWMIL